MPATPAPRIALCLEQTLGHRAHSRQLEAAARERGGTVDVVRVEYSESRVPWALRASLRARRALRARGTFDLFFFHTQSVALFAGQVAGEQPYVVSVDATPLQVDTMAEGYAHRVRPAPVERAKRAWYARVFRGAAGLVTWSRWAADSLVREYGVDLSRIRVFHPGAEPAYFAIDRRPHRGAPRILFVGGDFRRKGGEVLLEAFRALRPHAELTLVTDHPVPPEPGVEVLTGLRPGSPELVAAYASADVFCLPTLADCTPVALAEAMAAGLPIVTTDVGSNAEWVGPAAGILVPPGDVPALEDTLDRLVHDSGLRSRMGAGARASARLSLDARRNADALLDHLRELALEAEYGVAPPLPR